MASMIKTEEGGKTFHAHELVELISPNGLHYQKLSTSLMQSPLKVQ